MIILPEVPLMSRLPRRTSVCVVCDSLLNTTLDTSVSSSSTVNKQHINFVFSLHSEFKIHYIVISPNQITLYIRVIKYNI